MSHTDNEKDQELKTENLEAVESSEVEEEDVTIFEGDSVDGSDLGKKDSGNKKILLGIVAVILAIVVGVGVYINSKLNKVEQKEVVQEELQIDEKLEEELEEVEDEYLNVAIFGVNQKSAKDKALESDAVYVASLNRTTKEIKIFSVYGNTMLVRNGKSVRLKDVYAAGGAQDAIAVLNENLALNIQDYVTINFKCMVDTINILGGIEIDVKKEEIPHINGYTAGIAKELKRKAKAVSRDGKQRLGGVQATAYCRIRVTDGGDVKRAERQKIVIQQILETLKKANFSQMDQIMDVVFPQVQTNFDKAEMLKYGNDAATFKVTTLPAFPREIEKQVRKPKKEGVQFNDFEEVVKGKNMKKDVEDIHKELFSAK